MRKLTIALLLISSFAFSQANSPVKNKDFKYLKNYNNKEWWTVKLFSNEKFVARLKKLTGNNYSMIKGRMEVAGPMSVYGTYFTADGCKQHMCDSDNAIIVYDFYLDKFTVGIEQDYKKRIFTEYTGKNSEMYIPQQVKDWYTKN